MTQELHDAVIVLLLSMTLSNGTVGDDMYSSAHHIVKTKPMLNMVLTTGMQR